MKKRILTFLLAIVMILSVVPATALTANAASALQTSNRAIELLKEFEGFEKYQYKSGSNYYIGYGTQIENGAYPNGITTEDATALLKAHLKNNVDTIINAFTKSYNLNLSQNQHDALALYCYNCGNINALKEAVRTGKSGNEMINIWAQLYGGNPSGENFKGLINRRLAEVNMYLNNSYGYNKPANYTYVILDLDGDKVVESTDKVIAYDYNKVQTLSYVPTAAEANGCSPDAFLGWYVLDTAKNELSGTAVTKLNKDVAGKTLVAKHDLGSDFGNASYTINTNTLPSLKVYNTTYNKADFKANMDEAAKGTLRANTKFAVDTEKMVDGIKWIRGVGTGSNGKKLEGWVYMGELPEADVIEGKPIETATVTASSLTIRSGATVNSDPVGTPLNKGVTVDIYEIRVEKTETGNKRWGKVSVNGVVGWINLAYTVEKATSGTTDAANGKTGTIINTDEVNVRSDAGTNFAVLTSLKKGTKVTILDTKNNNGNMWALVQWEGLKDGYTKGWVYMYYIEVKGAEHSNPSAPSVNLGVAQYTGVVTSNINLNVRSKPDIYATRVSSLPTGTKVTIYDTKTSGGMKWGQIGDGQWVCLSYVKLTALSGANGTVTPGEAELQGTVTANTLSILKNYNNNAAAVGTLKKGTVVTILEKNTETTETGSRIWGRIQYNGVEGWINLAYVDLKSVANATPDTSTGTTTVTNTNGVIANCLSVNVREGAGVRNNAITKLNNGTPVVIKERTYVDEAYWGRITWNNGANEGWVALMYVNTTAGATGTTGNTGSSNIVNGTNSNTISATGYVKNAYVNVRSGAGLGYAQVGTLNQGAKVTLFEQAVADGMIWGRIQYNGASAWVCMSYITVESASSTGKGVMGTVARCFTAANVRSAPGTGNALIGTVKVGSRVEVFETRLHGDKLWGRIAQGWVCMDYILLDSELPPGTALDATVPTTQATTPSATETVNTNGEIGFIIEASIKQDLNVRNDANANSTRVGTINAGMLVDIKAVKNNGAELWGRIDQYATAGWINLGKDYASYAFTRYVAVDEQPIYVDASTSSAVKGTLPVNTYLVITKITTDGTNVYGWVEEGIYGWIPLSKTSEKEVDVLTVYKSGDSVGSSGSAMLQGKTFAAMDAVDSIGGSRVLFKMNSGVTVYVETVKFEGGRVWGYVQYAMPGSDSGEYGYAWIDMSKVNYSVAGKIVGSEGLNVRSSMDASTSAADEPNNIITTLASGTSVNICQLTFDSYGNVWARLNGDYSIDAETNGAFVMVMTSGKTVYVETALTPAA